MARKINDHHPKLKDMTEQNIKDGIMRRNGLLLEHIMHDRMNKDKFSADYFKTPENIEWLKK